MPMVGVSGGRTDVQAADWTKGGWMLLYQTNWQRVPGSPLFPTQREGERWRDFNNITEPTILEFRRS